RRFSLACPEAWIRDRRTTVSEYMIRAALDFAAPWLLVPRQSVGTAAFLIAMAGSALNVCSLANKTASLGKLAKWIDHGALHSLRESDDILPSGQEKRRSNNQKRIGTKVRNVCKGGIDLARCVRVESLNLYSHRPCRHL